MLDPSLELKKSKFSNKKIIKTMSTARQQARALGNITEAFLLNNPSKEELHFINTLPEAALRRKVKDIYFVSEGKPKLAKNANQIIPEKLLIWHEGWVEFWKKFGITIDLADYPILPHIKFNPGQEYWSIITPPEFSPMKSYEIRKGISKTFEGISPSKIIDIFPRVPVCIVIANQNARVEHPNISCGKSMEMGLWGTTFTEGTILDARVLVDLQIHLDESGWTVHTGSRSHDGTVPGSNWHPGPRKWYVFSNSVSNASSNLSLRSKQF